MLVLCRRLLRDRSGSFLILFGLLLVPIVGIVGFAIDLGRAYLAELHLQTAVDTTALAVAGLDGRSEEEVQRLASTMFARNYQSTAWRPTAQPRIVVDGSAVTVSAVSEVPTTLLSLFGKPTLSVAVSSAAVAAVDSLEVALVLDTTGSMNGSKMTAMRDAAAALVRILYGGEETVPGLSVALVPYSATVNIGAGRSAWLRDFDPTAYLPSAWRGCVEARHYPSEGVEDYDLTDDPPDVLAWRPHFWPTTYLRYHTDGGVRQGPDYDADPSDYLQGDNDWNPQGLLAALREDNGAGNAGTGPNLGCPQEVLPLTLERGAVLDRIDDLLAWSRGGTFSNLGLAWGWRMLSPRWRGLWGASELPAADEVQKAVVLLTDGVNQWYDWPQAVPGRGKDDDGRNIVAGENADYSAYGRLADGRLGVTTNGQANDAIDARMLNLCTRIKAAGIRLYTITFMVNDADTRTLFETCATSAAHYFDSPSTAELEGVFAEIGRMLTRLPRLTR